MRPKARLDAQGRIPARQGIRSHARDLLGAAGENRLAQGIRVGEGQSRIPRQARLATLHQCRYLIGPGRHHHARGAMVMLFHGKRCHACMKAFGKACSRPQARGGDEGQAEMSGEQAVVIALTDHPFTKTAMAAHRCAPAIRPMPPGADPQGRCPYSARKAMLTGKGAVSRQDSCANSCLDSGAGSCCGPRCCAPAPLASGSGLARPHVSRYAEPNSPRSMLDRDGIDVQKHVKVHVKTVLQFNIAYCDSDWHIRLLIAHTLKALMNKAFGEIDTAPPSFSESGIPGFWGSARPAGGARRAGGANLAHSHLG